MNYSFIYNIIFYFQNNFGSFGPDRTELFLFGLVRSIIKLWSGSVQKKFKLRFWVYSVWSGFGWDRLNAHPYSSILYQNFLNYVRKKKNNNEKKFIYLISTQSIQVHSIKILLNKVKNNYGDVTTLNYQVCNYYLITLFFNCTKNYYL